MSRVTGVVLCVLCRHAVTDMAWTPDGMTLLACSGDGTIALLMFSEKELGTPLSQVRQTAASSCSTPVLVVAYTPTHASMGLCTSP